MGDDTRRAARGDGTAGAAEGLRRFRVVPPPLVRLDDGALVGRWSRLAADRAHATALWLGATAAGRAVLAAGPLDARPAWGATAEERWERGWGWWLPAARPGAPLDARGALRLDATSARPAGWRQALSYRRAAGGTAVVVLPTHEQPAVVREGGRRELALLLAGARLAVRDWTSDWWAEEADEEYWYRSAPLIGARTGALPPVGRWAAVDGVGDDREPAELAVPPDELGDLAWLPWW